MALILVASAKAFVHEAQKIEAAQRAATRDEMTALAEEVAVALTSSADLPDEVPMTKFRHW